MGGLSFGRPTDDEATFAAIESLGDATFEWRGVGKCCLAGVPANVLDFCAKSKLWSVWYDHPDGHATSNMLDRLMRSQNGFFDCGQHFHGDLASANLRSRAWAILHN